MSSFKCKSGRRSTWRQRHNGCCCLSSIILWSVQDGGSEIGVFSFGVPVDALFFIGNQLVALSHTGKVGLWNAVTQHWQVQDIVPITSYDTAGSFLLQGWNNGSI